MIKTRSRINNIRTGNILSKASYSSFFFRIPHHSILGITLLSLVTLCWLAPVTVSAAPETGAPAVNKSTANKAAPKKDTANKLPTDPKIDPRSLEANDQGIAALRTGNSRSAEERFRRALEIEPGNVTAAFNLAGTLVVNGKKLEAISLLSDYERRYPGDAGVSVRLGDTLFSSEKIKEALGHYERAFALQSSYPRLSEKLGLGYALLQRFEDSEKMYAIAAEQNPTDGEIWANLASTQLANKKYKAAIDSATKAVQIKPTANVFVTLGSAHEASGAPVEALAAFRRAKELGDKSAELNGRLADLEKLVSSKNG